LEVGVATCYHLKPYLTGALIPLVGNVIGPHNTNQETSEEDCSFIHTIEKKELE